MEKSNSPHIDYKTHILIGVRGDGVMTVISDWSHVPTQAEVQREIDVARNGYVTFALCTPTSVMPASGDASAGGRSRFDRGA